MVPFHCKKTIALTTQQWADGVAAVSGGVAGLMSRTLDKIPE